jgi:hypothetical protein
VREARKKLDERTGTGGRRIATRMALADVFGVVGVVVGVAVVVFEDEDEDEKMNPATESGLESHLTWRSW